MKELEILNMLRSQRDGILRQIPQLDTRIGELRRHITTLRSTNRRGDGLTANTAELETAQKRKDRLLDQVVSLSREISEISNRIIDRERAQHLQAQDELWRDWQSHPDAFSAWKARRRRELAETPPKE